MTKYEDFSKRILQTLDMPVASLDEKKEKATYFFADGTRISFSQEELEAMYKALKNNQQKTGKS